MFCLLIVCSFSIHLGVDFGSQFMKSSIAKVMDNPEIAYNYDSKRLTPSFIALKASSNFNFSSSDPLTIEDGKLLNPVFGNNAIEVMSLRPWLGSAFLSSYIGLLKNESDRISHDLFVNTSAARLSLNELSTIFFKLYIDCVSNEKIVNSINVVVPSIFTIPQRREVETIVRGAGFKFLRAIDDTEAISNIYSLEKYNKFSQQPKTVLFIDVGATSIKSYCITFELKKDETQKYGIPQTTRLSYVFADEQGGAYLTRSLVFHIISKYELSNLKDAEYQRLFMAAEKIKIQLTLLKSASTIVENINGEDREIKISREELESIAEPFIQKTIETAKKASDGIEFDDIEVIGGSSRVPIILSSIQQAFNVSFVGHSLNADEALCAGAGYSSQFQNGISKFQKVVLNTPYSSYNVSLKLSNNETFNICELNGPCIDNITINDTITQFEIIYENANTSLLKTNSFGYKVEMKPNSTLLIRFSKSSPIDAISGRMCVNRSFCQYIPMYPLVPIFASSPSFHAIMTAHAQKKRLGKIRNELEHLTLRVIDEVKQNESVRAFTNDEQRFRINEVAERTKKWIWEKADLITDEKNFTHRYNEIRDVILPVYNRIRENRTMMLNVQLMLRAIQLSKLQVYLEWPVNKSYINKTEIDNFTQLLNQTEEWFLKALNETKDAPLWEENKVKSKDFEARTRKLTQEMIRISKIPPPPKKRSRLMSSLSNTWSKFTGLFKNRPVKKSAPPKNKKKSSPKQTPKASPSASTENLKVKKATDKPVQKDNLKKSNETENVDNQQDNVKKEL